MDEFSAFIESLGDLPEDAEVVGFMFAIGEDGVPVPVGIIAAVACQDDEQHLAETVLAGAVRPTDPSTN
jgi:hypothetical protein